jgi:hypothetical protein
MKIDENHFDRERRYGNNLFKLFMKNNSITELIDKWFHDNDLSSMKVKSKAWQRLSGKATKIIEAKIATHFNIPPANVKYSRKCGCKCGCSPGYNVKLPDGHELARHNGWGEVDTSEDDLAILKKLINTKIPKLFAEDKAREKEIFKFASM